MRVLFVVKTICINILALLLAACSSTPQAPPNTLVVVKVDQVSLNADDGIWAKAPKLEIATTGVKNAEPIPGPTVSI